jgi:hypothetical protein
VVLVEQEEEEEVVVEMEVVEMEVEQSYLVAAERGMIDHQEEDHEYLHQVASIFVLVVRSSMFQ